MQKKPSRRKRRPQLPRLEVCSCQEAENYRVVLQKIVDFCTGDARPLTNKDQCSCGADDWRYLGTTSRSCASCDRSQMPLRGKFEGRKFNSFGACIQIVNLASEVLRKSNSVGWYSYGGGAEYPTILDLRDQESMQKLLVYIEEELS